LYKALDSWVLTEYRISSAAKDIIWNLRAVAGNKPAFRKQLVTSEGTILESRPAVSPRAPLLHVPGPNAFQRPVRAARHVIGAGVGDLRMPSPVDLPQPSALSSVAGSFGTAPGLVRDNPLRHARVNAGGIRRAMNIDLNV